MIDRICTLTASLAFIILLAPTSCSAPPTRQKTSGRLDENILFPRYSSVRTLYRSGSIGTRDSFWDDVAASPDRLWEDTKESFWDLENWLILGAAYASGVFLDSIGVEENISEYFETNDVIPSAAGNLLDELGSGYLLLGGAAAWYATAKLTDDDWGVHQSQNLLSSLVITGVSTLAFKQILRDERPNGVKEGYPSGHSSMSMATAVALGESFGPIVGIPAYLISAMVGWQRLDSNQHEFDDVIGGWALGYVIASSVFRRQETLILGGRVIPTVDGNGAFGLGIQWRF